MTLLLDLHLWDYRIVLYRTILPLLVLLPPKDTFRVRSALQFRLFWLNFREGAVSAAFVFCSILVAVNVQEKNDTDHSLEFSFLQQNPKPLPFSRVENNESVSWARTRSSFLVYFEIILST